MPIYDYLCEKCGTHIEVMQKISDAPLKRCAKCRGKLEKTVSRASVRLKHSPVRGTSRVIKDSPVRGKFSRREIREAVETVARRHGAN